MNSATATSWIEHAPDVCGGEARVRRTRIPVSNLVRWKRLGLSDEQLLSDFPGLTQEDLQTVWWYYESHKDEIEQAIQREEEAFNENGPSVRR